MKILLMLCVLAALLSSCAGKVTEKDELEIVHSFEPMYVYDEVHEVCLWRVWTSAGVALVALPKTSVKNPELPPSWNK